MTIRQTDCIQILQNNSIMTISNESTALNHLFKTQEQIFNQKLCKLNAQLDEFNKLRHSWEVDQADFSSNLNKSSVYLEEFKKDCNKLDCSFNYNILVIRIWFNKQLEKLEEQFKNEFNKSVQEYENKRRELKEKLKQDHEEMKKQIEISLNMEINDIKLPKRRKLRRRLNIASSNSFDFYIQSNSDSCIF